MKRALLPLLASTLAFTSVSQAFKFSDFVKRNSSSLAVNLSKHAYCQSSISSDAIEGTNTSTLVPIASVSKVFTSYFAVEKLGPYYRFDTKIHVLSFNEATATADIHIEGSDDPYFTYDKVFFMISELNKQGIKKIDRLTFDEKFRSFPTVRLGASPSNDIDAYKFAPVSSAQTQSAMVTLLKTNTWSAGNSALYNQTVAEAKQSGISMPSLATIMMRLNSIELLPSASFNRASAVKTFSLKSAPLFRYMKDYNAFSNNYIADQMARISGGIPAMLAFYNKKLGFTSNDLQMHTGSGLDEDNDAPVSQRKDNLATCEAVIKMMKAFARDVNAYSLTPEQQADIGKESLGLMDFMPIAGVNKGTYNGNDEQSAAVVFKTGTLGMAAKDPRINIAGYVRGEKDIMFYGIFFNYNKESQVPTIKSLRTQIISAILKEIGGANPFDGYKGTTKTDFLSFDANSKLQIVSATGAKITAVP